MSLSRTFLSIQNLNTSSKFDKMTLKIYFTLLITLFFLLFPASESLDSPADLSSMNESSPIFGNGTLDLI